MRGRRVKNTLNYATFRILVFVTRLTAEGAAWRGKVPDRPRRIPKPQPGSAARLRAAAAVVSHSWSLARKRTSVRLSYEEFGSVPRISTCSVYISVMLHVRHRCTVTSCPSLPHPAPSSPGCDGPNDEKLEIAERQKERLGLWLSVWWQTICVA